MRKKLITVGLVSALGASTSAWAVDLDSATPTPASYATDAVLTSDLTAGGLTILGGVALVETTAVGVGVATGNQVFIRFDLTNAAFDGAVATADMTTFTAAASLAVAQGGADASSFVIFDVTSAGITQASELTFAPGIAVSGAGSVTMTVYETLTQAVNQTESLYSKAGVFASGAAGAAVTATPATATAEVSTNFTQFTTGVDGTLGSILYALSTTATDPTDAGALADGDSFTAATSTMSLSGDVSFGDWYLDATSCTGAAGGEVDLVEDTTTFDTAAPAAAGIGGLTAAHIVCVEVDGTETINEGSYSFTLAYDTPATAVAPLADSTSSIGSIARNGTTVQIPYLTTFTDYNQRLVIVNRGATSAAYNITFTSEDGVTATAGTAASGTIPAGEVLSLKATDIVTLAGKTRTAATLTVVAPNTSIDVATNQVNLSDGSTDTVVLN